MVKLYRMIQNALQLNKQSNPMATSIRLKNLKSVDGASRGQARMLLRQWLTSGSAPNPLPSEHQIARNLGVAQPTVHRALLALEREGLVMREGRWRRPATQVLAGSKHVINGSIIVVSPYRLSVVNNAHSDAWIEGSTNGVIHAITEGDLNAMLLKPETLLGGVVSQILTNAPTGVVIPEMLEQSREHMEELVKPFVAAKIPVAVYSAEFELPGVDQVASDHEDGAYQLTHWLLEQGRRKIIRQTFAYRAATRWARDRRAGFERALREYGVEPMPDLEISGIPVEAATLAETLETRARLFAGYMVGRIRQVDAIMATSDGIVPYLARALRILEREPNQDILLTGYDNYWKETPERSLEPKPPVASVDKLNFQAGRELVGLVLQRSAGLLAVEPVVRLVKPKLVAPVIWNE